MLDATTDNLAITTRDEGPFWAAEAHTEKFVGADLVSYEVTRPGPSRGSWGPSRRSA